MTFDSERSFKYRNIEKPQNEIPNPLLQNAGRSLICIPGNSPHTGHKASHSVQEIGTRMSKANFRGTDGIGCATDVKGCQSQEMSKQSDVKRQEMSESLNV